MGEVSPTRYLVTAGWDHAPHLTPEAIAEMESSYQGQPHLLDARRNGTPSLGSGAIFPVPLSQILEPRFAIPEFWPRAYALDVGWRRTAALWGAWDPTDGTLHIYSEYYRGQAEPVIHAAAIKARGDWIRGVIDPASRGRSQKDGETLLSEYNRQGLHLTPAVNAVEAGLHACLDDFSIGQIRVFEDLENFKSEYRVYQRDENGRIVKKNDHLMDCVRYLRMSGKGVARTRPVARVEQSIANASSARDRMAGY